MVFPAVMPELEKPEKLRPRRVEELLNRGGIHNNGGWIFGSLLQGRNDEVGNRMDVSTQERRSENLRRRKRFNKKIRVELEELRCREGGDGSVLIGLVELELLEEAEEGLRVRLRDVDALHESTLKAKPSCRRARYGAESQKQG